MVYGWHAMGFQEEMTGLDPMAMSLERARKVRYRFSEKIMLHQKDHPPPIS
jgi:hypothetical protein